MASSQQAGRQAAVLGSLLLLVAALGVVVQLKDAWNTIWNVEDPKETSVWWYVRTYVLSLAGVLALGFLPAVSLLISTVLAALTTWVGAAFPESAIEHAVNFAVSLATISILFAMLFKWFPDTDVAWRDVWFGAIVAALLFNLGKGLIAWYFGTQALESTYGAAACIVVLLIRDYYAAQIVLFGAELTHAYAACAARAGPWEPTRPQPTVPKRLP